MTEAAQIFAFFSGALLLATFAIWANRLTGPMLQRLDGSRSSNNAGAEIGSRVLVVAFATGAVAAVLAIIGWLFG